MYDGVFPSGAVLINEAGTRDRVRLDLGSLHLYGARALRIPLP
jgi:hypothetical protein